MRGNECLMSKGRGRRSPFDDVNVAYKEGKWNVRIAAVFSFEEALVAPVGLLDIIMGEIKVR
ncbi:unnamed protein product [Meloidogyne enterolobii]|uniref:Uncharacterized protein n=1 Tax=Meloidogyne enterolobii TaxID=390850 RepID=A0ACB1A617_MELEN